LSSGIDIKIQPYVTYWFLVKTHIRKYSSSYWEKNWDLSCLNDILMIPYTDSPLPDFDNKNEIISSCIFC